MDLGTGVSLELQGDMPSLFRKFDSNGNGELTMDEFCVSCLHSFSSRVGTARKTINFSKLSPWNEKAAMQRTPQDLRIWSQR